MVADQAAGQARCHRPRQRAAGYLRGKSRAPGFAYAPDTPWQQELEASFPYEETLDQLRATAEVKLDMEAGRPMDRLVVGDVGYGKTEVALRGAFKALQGGRQVAVLVPTTVLAAQHFETFSQRLAAFPITVRLLSRFVAQKEQEAAVEGLAEGSVDIVIGTHRLLSKDVRFKNLGMVIVDEEQRFGVAAKERLKKLRREVDVLTLSATPIPRTLNLALAGVRDLSLIETPPEDRLPIQTRSPRPRPDSSATRSCASWTAAGRSSSSTTASRQSRPRPSSCASCCPECGSPWATARCRRASSRRS